MAENIEIRIDNPDIHGVGEIVVRTPHVPRLLQEPEASAADIKDGWMQSGDAGYFKRQQAACRDRPHQGSAETARGERFSPQYIETS